MIIKAGPAGSAFQWYPFPDCLALVTGFGVALIPGMGGSATPEYSQITGEKEKEWYSSSRKITPEILQEIYNMGKAWGLVSDPANIQVIRMNPDYQHTAEERDPGNFVSYREFVKFHGHVSRCFVLVIPDR